jgi:hypothetical protein
VAAAGGGGGSRCCGAELGASLEPEAEARGPAVAGEERAATLAAAACGMGALDLSERDHGSRANGAGGSSHDQQQQQQQQQLLQRRPSTGYGEQGEGEAAGPSETEARSPRPRLYVPRPLGTSEGLIEGVMIGRAAFNSPWLCLGDADRAVFGEPENPASSRRQVLAAYADYADAVLGRFGAKKDGSPDPGVKCLLKPLANLFHGEPGNKRWKNALDAAARGVSGDRKEWSEGV